MRKKQFLKFLDINQPHSNKFNTEQKVKILYS